MDIRLLDIDNANIIAVIGNKDTLFNTISALNQITEFFVDNTPYIRADNELDLDVDYNFITINVKTN